MFMKVWILQIPRLNDQITAGVKAVSQILTDHFVKNEIIDLNRQIYKSYYDSDKWDNLEKFGYKSTFDISLCPVAEIEKLFYEHCKKIQDGDVVFVSVFSVESRSWTSLVCTFLRKWFGKRIKIGIGGTGVRHPGETMLECEWADTLFDRKLIDIIMLGHVDKTLPDMINDRFRSPGKFYDQSKKFPEFGFHNKKLLNMDKEEQRVLDPNYIAKNSEGHSFNPNGDIFKPTIYFTQGCVKKCTFCDVPFMTPEWASRPAEKVIEEIDHYYNIDGRTEFHFADNTINGSDSEFIKFLQKFVDWQSKNEKIQWSSQYALKKKNQQTEELFDLMARSNGRLAVGFDHVSDPVLDHMKKLYKWADIQYFLEKTKQYNIPISLAMWIVGYPTETKDDLAEYEKLIDFLKTNGSSILAQSVLTCSINRNSVLLPLVDIDWHRPIHWKNKQNDLDFDERLERKKWLDEELKAVPQNYFKGEIGIQRLVNS
jgi:radical SAM superfamily enzyme YgiQ (UPF0313 family)